MAPSQPRRWVTGPDRGDLAASAGSTAALFAGTMVLSTGIAVVTRCCRCWSSGTIRSACRRSRRPTPRRWAASRRWAPASRCRSRNRFRADGRARRQPGRCPPPSRCWCGCPTAPPGCLRLRWLPRKRGPHPPWRTRLGVAGHKLHGPAVEPVLHRDQLVSGASSRQRIFADDRGLAPHAISGRGAAGRGCPCHADRRFWINEALPLTASLLVAVRHARPLSLRPVRRRCGWSFWHGRGAGADPRPLVHGAAGQRPDHRAALAVMAQSIGYLIAAFGPVAFGFIDDRVGRLVGRLSSFACALAILQGFLRSRRRTLGEDLTIIRGQSNYKNGTFE